MNIFTNYVQVDSSLSILLMFMLLVIIFIKSKNLYYSKPYSVYLTLINNFDVVHTLFWNFEIMEIPSLL